MSDTESNQTSKFRTGNWVEINDESRGTYASNDIKFSTTITGTGDDDTAKRLDERNKAAVFKNFAPFTKCISRINNTDIDNAQDIEIVMLMYNLIEYSDNYSKTSGSLWKYYKDDPNDNMYYLCYY